MDNIDTLEVDFGTWNPRVDPILFEHRPNDGRTSLVMHSDILVKNENGDICAKRTARQARKKIRTQFGKDFNPSHIRWHKSTEFKRILGDRANHLVTFIHEHLAA